MDDFSPGFDQKFLKYTPVTTLTKIEYIQVVTGNRETILVAEDENEVRHFVERVLAGAGYEVRSAANGAEAIDLAGQMPNLHLLVTDVVMPGMSGVQLAAVHVPPPQRFSPLLPFYASPHKHKGTTLRASGLGPEAWHIPHSASP